MTTDNRELVERLRRLALPDPFDEREVWCAKELREAADALERQMWVSVGTELPIDPRRVWFLWINRLGNRRTGAGSYVRKFEVSADHEDLPHEASDLYDWKNDEPFRKPGWYEEPHESEHYYLVTDEVTHWMPLPEPPEVK